MEGVKVTVSASANVGHFDRTEDVTYDIIDRRAKSLVHGGGKDDVKSNTKQRFEDDINRVRRLVRKEISSLNGRIENNKLVLRLYPDDEAEQKKTGYHLKRNQYKLAVLTEFMEKKKKK